MKRILAALAALACLFVLSSCASQAIPQQIPDAMKAACDIGLKVKPEVQQARAFAVTHWNDKRPDGSDVIPAAAKETLTEIDRHLPELDNALNTICLASDALHSLTDVATGQKVDWNQVLTVVLKGAGMAMDLKAKGSI